MANPEGCKKVAGGRQTTGNCTARPRTPDGCQICCVEELAFRHPRSTLACMGSTFYSLHYHWVCSTKERRPLIRAPWSPSFHEYLGGTIRGLDGVPLKIGGVEDHVHALIGLQAVHAISDFVRELKKATSVWASEQHEREFQWQEGYSIFSVSASMVPVVSKYIEGQPEHHRKHSFADELKALLEKHGVKYDPKYLV